MIVTLAYELDIYGGCCSEPIALEGVLERVAHHKTRDHIGSTYAAYLYDPFGRDLFEARCTSLSDTTPADIAIYYAADASTDIPVYVLGPVAFVITSGHPEDTGVIRLYLRDP